jgi:pimeloyl-ACP methyl ester carboxylesterase
MRDAKFQGTTMALIHHVVQGDGSPPIVFVHGLGCAHGDWDAQVAQLSPRHRTVAVDLRGHGATTATADECTIERYGADIVALVEALALPPAVMVGHSMGCRAVIEAAVQAPARVAGIILVDGSQFAAEMADTLKQAFATPDGLTPLLGRWFRDMFTAKSDPAVVASVVERAQRMPRAIGEALLLDLVRHDATRLTASLASLRAPVLAVQTTFANEKRERRSLGKGQTTPFLDMLRARIPTIRVEVIADTGHFPQIDEAAQVNALLDSFIASLPT